MQENPNESNKETKGAWHDKQSDCNSNVNTVKILNAVYNNALMAKESTEVMLKKVDNMELADILRQHVIKYEEFARSAQILANSVNCSLEEDNKTGRTMAKMSLNMKLMADDSITNVARIVILGTTNGVIDLGRLIRHTPDVGEKAEYLIKDLLGYEENRIEEMKYYL